MSFFMSRRSPISGSIPISPLPKQSALRQLDRYLEVCSRSSRLQSGGIVDLTSVPTSKPIVYVGDLHGRVDNLNKVLNTGNNYEMLRRGQLFMNILGDAVHPEKGPMEMDSSVVIMQQIMDLKMMHPNNFFYYAGNHDSFSMKAMREVNGFPVFPGVIMMSHLNKLYGESYVERFRMLIAGLPIVSIADGLITTHGGPIRPPFTMEQLVKLSHANEGDPLVKQAVWGRFECIEDPSISYDIEDVNDFLSTIGHESATLLVAHTKPDNMKWHKEIASNHHVIFGAFDEFGYASLKNRKLGFIEASDSPPFTTGRLPVEFFSDQTMPKIKKRPDGEIIRTNAAMFGTGGAYQRATVDTTIIPTSRSDVETYAFVEPDGTIVAFGKEQNLTHEQTRMLFHGHLYKIEISESFMRGNPERSTFDCTFPSGMPQDTRKIILKTFERVNRRHITGKNANLILEHTGPLSRWSKTTYIPLIMNNNGEILSVTDVPDITNELLDRMTSGELLFVKLTLSKPRLWSTPVFKLEPKDSTLLDGEVLIVTKMTVEALNERSH